MLLSTKRERAKCNFLPSPLPAAYSIDHFLNHFILYSLFFIVFSFLFYVAFCIFSLCFLHFLLSVFLSVCLLCISFYRRFSAYSFPLTLDHFILRVRERQSGNCSTPPHTAILLSVFRSLKVLTHFIHSHLIRQDSLECKLFVSF